MAVTFELIDNEFTRRWEARGHAQGREEGRAQGLVEGLAEAVVMLWEVRGFALSDEQRATVMTCKEVDQLKVWLKRAAAAAEPSAVLGEG